MTTLGFISMPGGAEWLVIGFVGLLLFGKRLPEVAQSLGKSVTEFKKGLQGITSEEPASSGASESPGIGRTGMEALPAAVEPPKPAVEPQAVEE